MLLLRHQLLPAAGSGAALAPYTAAQMDRSKDPVMWVVVDQGVTANKLWQYGEKSSSS